MYIYYKIYVIYTYYIYYIYVSFQCGIYFSYLLENTSRGT